MKQVTVLEWNENPVLGDNGLMEVYVIRRDRNGDTDWPALFNFLGVKAAVPALTPPPSDEELYREEIDKIVSEVLEETRRYPEKKKMTKELLKIAVKFSRYYNDPRLWPIVFGSTRYQCPPGEESAVAYRSYRSILADCQDAVTRERLNSTAMALERDSGSTQPVETDPELLNFWFDDSESQVAGEISGPEITLTVRRCPHGLEVELPELFSVYVDYFNNKVQLIYHREDMDMEDEGVALTLVPDVRRQSIEAQAAQAAE